MQETEIAGFPPRESSRRKVYQLLYSRGGMTKQEISNRLGISSPTVLHALRELLDCGLVHEEGSTDSTGGRKPAVMAVTEKAKLSIGIKISLGYFRIVITDLIGNPLFYKNVNERYENSESYLLKLSEATARLIGESGVDKKKLLGAGFAIPGTVQSKEGLLEYAPTLGLKNLHTSTLEPFFPFPLMFENQANLAGFAEIRGREKLNDAVYLSLDRGVGGAVILNNQIYKGQNSRAGELGHMAIVKDGMLCYCGKRGCLEAYCSAERLLGRRFDDLDGFFGALYSGDLECAGLWDSYLDYLAVGVNNLRMAFDTEIILGGDLAPYIERFLGPLQEKLKELNSFESSADFIQIGRYGGMAGVIGAALLPIDKYLHQLT